MGKFLLGLITGVILVVLIGVIGFFAIASLRSKPATIADGSTLIVAESHGNRLTAYDIGQDGDLANRRTWADTGDDHPDGICVDAEGAVWYADVGNRHCVRVREGGEVLAAVELDRGAFACTLSRGDRPQLYVVGQEWAGAVPTEPTGQIVVFPAPAPGAGKP